MDSFDWENLSMTFTAIGSREIFEGLFRSQFAIFNIEHYMRALAYENTVCFYVDRTGYQLDWTGTEDFYTVL